MKVIRPESNFWKDKRVLVTGHTGFKGSWLSVWLNRLGARVSGIGLQPNTDPNLFQLAGLKEFCDGHFCDIRDKEALLQIIENMRPEVIFHLAAQPLVRHSYLEPVETYSTNVMGTVHLLDALRSVSCARVAIIVSTDKVYRNKEWHFPYREDDTLGGHDPYSTSKAASELVIASYRDSFLGPQGVAVASARAGNVIGGGDWSADRLIPDAIRSWQNGQSLEVRRPAAVRPWQHVLEPLSGYLILAEKLWANADLAESYNFGPTTQEAVTVRDVVELARKFYGSDKVNYDNIVKGPHEAGFLALENSKVRHTLGVAPCLTLPESVKLTVDWYQSQSNGLDAHTLCENDIAFYEAFS